MDYSNDLGSKIINGIIMIINQELFMGLSQNNQFGKFCENFG